jgi:hypothetical protein
MNDNIIYNPTIICLFTDDFDTIKKKYDLKTFNWENYKQTFNYIYSKISDENIKINYFIKYYYIFTFIYLGYTNYLAYIGHPDIYNEGLEKIANKIKTSIPIVKNLMKFSNDDNICKIIKLNDIFIINKIKKKKVNNTNIQKYIQDYIFDLKQFEKISNLSNDNYKKILNLIIYRYIICKKNNYINYHELYLKRIVGKNNIHNNSTHQLDFDYFMEQIPKSKKILNIILNPKPHSNIEVSINKLINYILSKSRNEFHLNLETDTIIIKHKKFQGQIKINISTKYENIELNHYQTNYNFLHYNIEELNEFNFLKKTFANIEINIFDNILKDFSSIMEFMHLMILGVKILSTNPSDIYECLYPMEYSNYYFTTFCYFLDFFKKDINSNLNYNKFIIDVIKFLYIYSYYDYYFYFSNDFVETLITNLQYKNEIFLEFTQNLKKTLKLPRELNDFPPFFSQEFDINAIIYYNFEIPGYFKLYDFMNAIYHTFKLKSTNNKIDIFDLIVNNINIDNQSNYLNSASKSINIGIDNFNNVNKYKSDANSDSNSDSDSDSNSDSNSDSDSESKSDLDATSITNTDELTSSIYDRKLQKNKNINKYKKELETNLDTEIINILGDDDKIQMENKNAYVELNYKTKNENYILDTEC